MKIGKIGITDAFETWKEGVPYACRRGDIERTAGLTVEEGISAKSPRFRGWGKDRQPLAVPVLAYADHGYPSGLGGYRVIDANGLALAHVYGQPPDAVAFSDKRLKRLPVPEVANHLVCSVCGARNDEIKRPIHARPDARVPGVTGSYPRW